MDSLVVLNGSGHMELTWDPHNAEEVASTRQEVARLKAAGYSFFLTTNEPADEVAAGAGKLIVRRIEDPTNLPEPEPETTETQAPTGKRGRPPGKPNRTTVAVQPMRGG